MPAPERTFTRRLLIVVAVADLPRGNAAAARFDLNGSLRTFVSPLSPTGELPATHYWASTALTEPTYQAIRAQAVPLFPDAVFQEWDLDEDPTAPERLLASLGLKTIALPGR